MRDGWRKSSYSGGGNGNCVEVAVGTTAVGVRDSKNTVGPILEFPVDQWQAFLTAGRPGQTRECCGPF